MSLSYKLIHQGQLIVPLPRSAPIFLAPWVACRLCNSGSKTPERKKRWRPTKALVGDHLIYSSWLGIGKHQEGDSRLFFSSQTARLWKEWKSCLFFFFCPSDRGWYWNKIRFLEKKKGPPQIAFTRSCGPFVLWSSGPPTHWAGGAVNLRLFNHSKSSGLNRRGNRRCAHVEPFKFFEGVNFSPGVGRDWNHFFSRVCKLFSRVYPSDRTNHQ